MASEPFIGLRAASALRRLGDQLCEQAGFRPDVIFEGDDLSNVRGFVAAGLGVAVVPAPRAGSPEAGPGPVAYLEILDPGAVREIFLTWSAERRLLPATDLFRRHVIRRAAAGRLPAVSDLSRTNLAHHFVQHRAHAAGARRERRERPPGITCCGSVCPKSAPITSGTPGRYSVTAASTA